MNNNVVGLFSVPITKSNIRREFTEKEIQLFLPDNLYYKVKDADNHRSKEDHLFDTFSKELKEIKNFCDFRVKEYLKEIEGVDTDIAGLRITQAWLNKTKYQERHHEHFHSNSYLSGCLYIQCLPNDHIVLKNRSKMLFNNMEFSPHKPTAWNYGDYEINVTEGDLLIFPSWVPHYVDTNETNMERVSLAFNTFPVGKLGHKDPTALNHVTL